MVMGQVGIQLLLSLSQATMSSARLLPALAQWKVVATRPACKVHSNAGEEEASFA